MPATSRLNNGSTLDAPVRAYITTGAFATRIFTYATNFNSSTYETTGTLTALGTGTAVNTVNTASNVAGIVLRETGKKLYVGINPGIVTYMVGVFYNGGSGSVQGFNGFIDPNDSVYAPFNTDKPYFLEDARRFTVSSGVATPGAADQGAPVYSAGAITSTSSTAGIGYATGAGSSPTAGDSPITSATICGRVSFNDNVASTASVSMTVTNALVDENDTIILNLQSGQDVVYRIITVSTGSFVIRVTNNTGASIDSTYVFNFAIIKSVVA